MWDLRLGTALYGKIRLDKQGQPVLRKSQPPEILFIERCLQLLRPGTGRMAMVIPNGIRLSPNLAYVREWMLHNVQILAVVDMHRDLFQPKNDTQTSMVLMRRLSASEQALAAGHGLEYDCFMAVTERIGHDKRGQAIYRRNAKGEDILVPRTEQDGASGAGTSLGPTVVEVLERVIDDELPEAADAYREWLVEQDR